MGKECLDIKKIETVDDLNRTDFSRFTSETFKNWVKYLVYPISQKELNRICELAKDPNSNVNLGNSMGDLYYRAK